MFAIIYIYQIILNNYCAHVTPYPSDPASEDCLASHPGSSSLVSVLEAKCDEDTCSSLRACLLDPAGDRNTPHVSVNTQIYPGDLCSSTYGPDAAPAGLVAALPGLQDWVARLRAGAGINCWMTRHISPR